VLFFTLVPLLFLALISPGPDFTIVVKNSLVYSKKTAFYTAFGVALSNLFHESYSLIGLGILIAKYDWLLELIKLSVQVI
jgi:threonine/homoserine/homoserine lactone efflux protein